MILRAARADWGESSCPLPPMRKPKLERQGPRRIVCSSCNTPKTLGRFSRAPSGARYRTCIMCRVKKASQYAAKRRAAAAEAPKIVKLEVPKRPRSAPNASRYYRWLVERIAEARAAGHTQDQIDAMVPMWRTQFNTHLADRASSVGRCQPAKARDTA